MINTVTRLIGFDAGHRLVGHESKCANIHGHRYLAEITCVAEDLDSVGRVIDFGVIKERVGKWIDDNWDHAFLVNVQDVETIAFLKSMNQRYFVFNGEPSAENIAAVLAYTATALLGDTRVKVTSVKLWETPNCYALVTL